jgi:hypothetical protein
VVQIFLARRLREFVDAADLKVPAEDQPDPFGVLFNDDKLAVPPS